LGGNLKILCVINFTVFAEEENKSCCPLCPGATTQRSMEVNVYLFLSLHRAS